jgi:hypothetical protein
MSALLPVGPMRARRHQGTGVNSRAHAVIRTIGVRRWQREALLRADQYFSYSWEYGGEPFGSSLRRTESDWWYQCIGLIACERVEASGAASADQRQARPPRRSTPWSVCSVCCGDSGSQSYTVPANCLQVRGATSWPMPSQQDRLTSLMDVGLFIVAPQSAKPAFSQRNIESTCLCCSGFA